jgi:hypothetical protein
MQGAIPPGVKTSFSEEDASLAYLTFEIVYHNSTT